MAKRSSGTTRTSGGKTASAPRATTAGAMEQRVVALSRRLGRLAGIVDAKTDGWLSRGEMKAAEKTPAAPAARGAAKGRSGGAVDAPGKRHRKPMPADPDANVANSQAAKMRTAKTMVKTNRLRGRG